MRNWVNFSPTLAYTGHLLPAESPLPLARVMMYAQGMMVLVNTDMNFHVHLTANFLTS
jgi:hypothetical protein